MTWLLARLKEPSSWRGIVWLLTVAGISLKPDQVEAIVVAGMAIAGLLGVFTNDLPTSNSQNQRTELPPIELQARPGSSRSGRLADSDVDLVADRRVAGAVDSSSSRSAERMQSPVSSECQSEPFGFNDR